MGHHIISQPFALSSEPCSVMLRKVIRRAGDCEPLLWSITQFCRGQTRACRLLRKEVTWGNFQGGVSHFMLHFGGYSTIGRGYRGYSIVNHCCVGHQGNGCGGPGASKPHKPLKLFLAPAQANKTKKWPIRKPRGYLSESRCFFLEK